MQVVSVIDTSYCVLSLLVCMCFSFLPFALAYFTIDIFAIE
jgi:hypothetical protein